MLLDTSDARVRERFATVVSDERRRLTRAFRRLGIDEIEIRTDAPYAAELLGFFDRRERRLRR